MTLLSGEGGGGGKNTTTQKRVVVLHHPLPVSGGAFPCLPLGVAFLLLWAGAAFSLLFFGGGAFHSRNENLFKFLTHFNSMT